MPWLSGITSFFDRVLTRHSILKKLILRFGECNLSTEDLRAIANSCLDLETIEFKWDSISILIQSDNSPSSDFNDSLKEIATELVQLPRLSELRLAMRPRPSVPFAQTIRA